MLAVVSLFMGAYLNVCSLARAGLLGAIKSADFASQRMAFAGLRRFTILTEPFAIAFDTDWNGFVGTLGQSPISDRALTNKGKARLFVFHG